MDFLDKAIDEYVISHTSGENALLAKISRETRMEVLMPRMLSGHLQGRVLSMFSHMIKPEFILEIGTYTGYSALCLAEGLRSDGKIVTIDVNEELERRVRNYFSESEFSHQIDYRIGDAGIIIPELEHTFDLVFIDADKENYYKYFTLVFEKVRKGGFIIADNVLWSGRVIAEKKDKDTQSICEFNDRIFNDDRVEKVLFPVRDGLMVIRKR